MESRVVFTFWSKMESHSWTYPISDWEWWLKYNLTYLQVSTRSVIFRGLIIAGWRRIRKTSRIQELPYPGIHPDEERLPECPHSQISHPYTGSPWPFYLIHPLTHSLSHTLSSSEQSPRLSNSQTKKKNPPKKKETWKKRVLSRFLSFFEDFPP